MSQLKRLAVIFISVFLVALGYEYGPPEIKFALGAAIVFTAILWVLGYVDVADLLDLKKRTKGEDK